MPTTTPAFAFAGAASDTAIIKASKPIIVFFSISLPSNFCTFKTQPEWKVAIHKVAIFGWRHASRVENHAHIRRVFSRRALWARSPESRGFKRYFETSGLRWRDELTQRETL
jgi:hypothetical protein